MKGHTMKGHRCQWHDLVCDKELESCIECERFPDNEGKPNFTAEPMQARIKPHRLLNDSLFFILFSLFLTFLNILSHLIGKSYSI